MTTKPGFNGQGIIDLRDFEQLSPREQNDATFVGFDFLDLDEVDIDNEDYFNLAIRDENDDLRIEALQVRFSNVGFLTKYWPPCFGTDNRPRDGRGRIKAAKLNGEKWLPIARYHYSNNSNRNYITNGLIANDHDPATLPKMENFITSGVTLIRENELECEEAAVSEWLYKEARVQRFFSNKGGVITKIIDGILKRGIQGGDPLTHRQSRKSWIEWIKKHLKTEINDKTILLCVDSETYAYRAWCEHILPAISKCQDPVDIILYTNEYLPEEARKNIKMVVNKLHFYHDVSFRMVNNALQGITIQAPKPTCYRILGAVPQVYGKHDLTGRKLVPIDQY